MTGGKVRAFEKENAECKTDAKGRKSSEKKSGDDSKLREGNGVVVYRERLRCTRRSLVRGLKCTRKLFFDLSYAYVRFTDSTRFLTHTEVREKEANHSEKNLHKVESEEATEKRELIVPFESTF